MQIQQDNSFNNNWNRLWFYWKLIKLKIHAPALVKKTNVNLLNNFIVMIFVDVNLIGACV